MVGLSESLYCKIYDNNIVILISLIFNQNLVQPREVYLHSVFINTIKLGTVQKVQHLINLFLKVIAFMH